MFFFNDTATTEIYTLSLHDALPISQDPVCPRLAGPDPGAGRRRRDQGDGDLAQQDPDHRQGPRDRQDQEGQGADRKSTRLNSSHANISYAVFCLKKKNTVTMTRLFS